MAFADEETQRKFEAILMERLRNLSRMRQQWLKSTIKEYGLTPEYEERLAREHAKWGVLAGHRRAGSRNVRRRNRLDGWSRLNPNFDFTLYEYKAGQMTDAQLRAALRDIYKTMPHSRQLDREDGGGREGWYADEASVYRLELARRQAGKPRLGAAPDDRKKTVILLGLAIVGVVLWSRSAKASTVTPGKAHTVQKGESWSSIAARAYGDYRWWPFLWDANRTGVAFANPDALNVGDVVAIPVAVPAGDAYRSRIFQRAAAHRQYWADKQAGKASTMPDIVLEQTPLP